MGFCSIFNNLYYKDSASSEALKHYKQCYELAELRKFHRFDNLKNQINFH